MEEIPRFDQFGAVDATIMLSTVSFDACIHIKALHPNMIKTCILVMIYSYMEPLVSCEDYVSAYSFLFSIYEICLGMLILVVFVIC